MNKRVLGLFILFSSIYLYFQSNSIYGGDAGELATAAYIKGIPHSPGFPLYQIAAQLIIKLIPFGTVAWKVSLLSSIPSAIAHVMLFLLLIKLTKSKFLAIGGTLIYSFLYPIWLFSIVPEVISVNIMFIVLIIYLSIQYSIFKKLSHLPYIILVSGIALFHNYLISIIMPGVIFLLYNKQTISKLKKKLLVFSLLFLVGFLPYTYFIYLSSKFPALDFDHPASIQGLIALITRGSYGPFSLSRGTFFSFNNAINGLANFLNFILTDFKIIGILFILLGLIYLYKNHRKLFNYCLISIATCFLFIAYASFPLGISLHFGIFEKYLPIPYLFFSILIIFGILYIRELINSFLRNMFLKKISVAAIYVSILIYAGILYRNNYPRILVLKNDFTAENVGRDILASVPKNGIVNISDDTGYFNTLYVRYVLEERKDVKIVSFDKLKNPYYRTYLAKTYPDFVLPDPTIDDKNFLRAFLDKNSRKYNILSAGPSVLVTETWLPNGLLWQYYPKYAKLPTSNELISKNLRLWEKLHLPLSNSLGKYENLLLEDVLRIYARGHQSFGMTLHKAEKYQLAENEFKTAILYFPEDVNNYIQLAKTYITVKKCDDADSTLDKAKIINKEKLEIYKYYISLYANCFQDIDKAEEYTKLYEFYKNKNNKDIPVNQL